MRPSTACLARILGGLLRSQELRHVVGCLILMKTEALRYSVHLVITMVMTCIFFDSSMKGSISQHPAGKNGFGFDEFFVMDGYDITRAEMPQDEVERTYAENMKPFHKVRKFLEEI